MQNSKLSPMGIWFDWVAMTKMRRMVKRSTASSESTSRQRMSKCITWQVFLKCNLSNILGWLPSNKKSFSDVDNDGRRKNRCCFHHLSQDFHTGELLNNLAWHWVQYVRRWVFLLLTFTFWGRSPFTSWGPTPKDEKFSHKCIQG